MGKGTKLLGWLLQQLVPPALLTYFFVCWRICYYEVGPHWLGDELGFPFLGAVYSVFSTVSIATMVALYLRLYFLPKGQSRPPFNPPHDLVTSSKIFECLGPDEAKAVQNMEANAASSSGANETSTLLNRDPDPSLTLVNRCFKPPCSGRWKPARARHCSTCNTCRAGFDHHCAIFANCLTAPYIPTFLCLLVSAPITIFLLSSPLLLPLGRKALAAWNIAARSEDIRRRWWEWKLSWIIAGGPMGRWIGGTVLGWKEPESTGFANGNQVLRVGVAGLVLVGLAISAICLAWSVFPKDAYAQGLAATTIHLVQNGQLTIDRERSRAHSRALHAIHLAEQAGRPITSEMRRAVERWADIQWFSVPIPLSGSDQAHPTSKMSTDQTGGVRRMVLPTLPHEKPYDQGSKQRNWEQVMGSGWGWLLPWQAVRLGMSEVAVLEWPLNPDVEVRLRRLAAEEL